MTLLRLGSGSDLTGAEPLNPPPPLSPAPAPSEWARECARDIGENVAAVFAADVDAAARFPNEAIAALREAKLLGALIPKHLGGLGLDFVTVADTITELGRHCSSTGMVLAMHHIQVACLVRHGRNDQLQEFVRRVAAEQLLLASATTEAGIGGNTRSSGCAVVRSDGRFELVKQAPVISYGQYADAILATARRDADSAPNDQVLVLCQGPDLALEPVSEWNTLGFRGTCSLGFRLDAAGPQEWVLDDGFSDISAQTMLPVAHLLWASLWLGMSLAAYERTQRFVQAESRKKLGVTPPGALRLAELAAHVQQLGESVRGLVRRYDAIGEDADALSALDFAVALNTLKISASSLVVEIVTKALLICGIAGYREDSAFSLGRLLRDAHGAALMVNNERILANTAQSLLAQRGRR